MPTRFEAHAKVQGFAQPYRLYGDRRHLLRRRRRAPRSAAAPAPSRGGSTLNHLTSDAQPMSFVVKNVAGDDQRGGNAGHRRVRRPQPAGGAGLRARRDAADAHAAGPRQGQARLRLHADAARLVHARLVAQRRRPRRRLVPARCVGRDGDERADAGGGEHRRPQLHRPADRLRALDGVDGAPHPRPRRQEQHARRRGTSRSPPASTTTRATSSGRRCRTPATASAGRITDQHGTGWNTLARKGIWRPRGTGGAHVVEFGAQRDAFKLRDARLRHARLERRRAGGALLGVRRAHLARPASGRRTPGASRPTGAPCSAFAASTGRPTDGTPVERDDDARLRAAQRDARLAEGGALLAGDAKPGCCAPRSAAPSACRPSASCSRARSRPTRSSTTIPNLKPEKSWTSELTAERAFAGGSARATFFFEETQDALYSQVNVAAGGTVATIQNVDRIRTLGSRRLRRRTTCSSRGWS